jgi:hypothetical protein
MKTYEIIVLRKRILAGIDLAYRKLVDERSLEDGELVFSKDGKIVKIKAREIQKNVKNN